MKNFFKQNWALVLILLLALFFRFYQINHFPGGLFPDEAANGLDINSMAHGQIQPFYERGNGREALFFYFEALSVLIFGRGVWQFHIVSASFGVASVIALYFLGKRLFGRRTALIASLCLAVSSYAVTVTRTAFRATTVPFISTMTIFFLVKFFQETDRRKKYWSAALGGLFFALGFYTYTSYRMMLPLVGGFLVLILLAERDRLKKVWQNYKSYAGTFVLVFLLAISWIAIWFIRHPGDFVGRAGEVSIFNKELNNGDVVGTLITVVKKTFFSFFTVGDTNYRQNVAGFPFLSPFLSPFFGAIVLLFLFSVLRMLKQIWRKTIQPNIWYQALVVIWFAFMVVPEISTAEGIPHGLRLIGVIPPMFLMVGFGLNWLWEQLQKISFFNQYKYYFAGIFFMTLVVYNYNLFFVVAANSPDYYYAYRSDLTVVSNYLNKRNQKNKTYLSLDTYSVQTTDYLTTDTNQPYILVDPAHTYEVKLTHGDVVVFTESTIFDRKKFIQAHPEARLINETKNQFGQLVMLVYQEP